MSDANPSRLGQINSAGDNLALFLKVFAGETLQAFHAATVFRDKHMVRTIPNGKSAQFPTSGYLAAYTHVPGQELLGNNLNLNEVVINVEGMQVAPWFIASIDEALNHYDVRSIFVNEQGQALAQLFDKNVARTMIAAARATTPIVSGVYPNDTLDSLLTNAGYATTGSTLFDGVRDAVIKLDERNMPTSDRYAYVRPVQHGLLVASEKPFDYRLNDGQTGLGGYAQGEVKMISGVPIIKTNNLPSTDLSADTSLPTTRRLDFSGTQALVAHKRAAGTVMLRDITAEGAYDIRRQGFLGVGKYIAGHGTLDNAAAIELNSSLS